MYSKYAPERAFLISQKQRESYRNDSSKYVSFPSGPITEKVGEIGETSQLKYYFYQLDTGENVYMHSLNITWLLKQFSDYAHFPQTVEGSVIDIEGSITQDEVTSSWHFVLTLIANTETISLSRTSTDRLQLPVLSYRYFRPAVKRKCGRF